MGKAEGEGEGIAVGDDGAEGGSGVYMTLLGRVDEGVSSRLVTLAPTRSY